MSSINLPNTFTDGNVSDAADIAQNIYDTTNTPESFEVINGAMDHGNHPGPGVFKFDRKAIQRGAFSGGKSIGADCNLDYFGAEFADYTNSVEDDGYYKALPGGAVSFHLPYTPSLVVFTWNVATVNASAAGVGPSGGTDDINGRVRLFINGSSISHQVLPIPEEGVGPETANLGIWRAWQGHYVATNLAAGWNSVSLRIVLNKEANNHIRVYARSLDYVYFR